MSGASFRYVRAAGLADALSQGSRHGAAYLAGGTDLLPLCKAALAAPQDVIDISRLPLADIWKGFEMYKTPGAVKGKIMLINN